MDDGSSRSKTSATNSRRNPANCSATSYKNNTPITSNVSAAADAAAAASSAAVATSTAPATAAATAKGSSGNISARTTNSTGSQIPQQRTQQNQPVRTGQPVQQQQQQHQQQQTQNNENDNNQGLILRIIARMFRQHADLFLKQASFLEQMSIQCTNPNNINHQQMEQTLEQFVYNHSTTAHQNHHQTSSSSSRIPLSHEDIEDKIRRESVIDLAKKSYEGMKEVKSIMNVLLKNKQSRITERRKFAFEIFQNDILSRIVKEDGYKNLLQARGGISHDNDKEDHSHNSDENAQALYVFNRTQEEWKKLNSKKIKEYATRAASDEGIQHLKLKASLPTVSTSTRTSTKKRRGRPKGTATKKALGEKAGKKRKLNQLTNKKDESEKEKDIDRPQAKKGTAKTSSKSLASDDSDSDKDNDDSSSHSKSSTSSVIIAPANDGNKESLSGPEDGGFEIPSMPPTIPISTPMKRERDDDSSSSEDEDKDDDSKLSQLS